MSRASANSIAVVDAVRNALLDGERTSLGASVSDGQALFHAMTDHREFRSEFNFRDPSPRYRFLIRAEVDLDCLDGMNRTRPCPRLLFEFGQSMDQLRLVSDEAHQAIENPFAIRPFPRAEFPDLPVGDIILRGQ